MMIRPVINILRFYNRDIHAVAVYCHSEPLRMALNDNMSGLAEHISLKRMQHFFGSACVVSKSGLRATWRINPLLCLMA